MKKINLVVLGVTSDLAKKKLLPAIFELWREKSISDKSKIVGVYNRPRTEQELQGLVGDKALLDRFDFVEGNFANENVYSEIMTKIDQKALTIFYLSTFPEFYQKIFEGIKKQVKLNSSLVRIVIEKPFGGDKKSAKDLNGLLAKFFEKEQIYRIDHYLGKETILNILAFRKNNLIVDQMLTTRNVDHIQITAWENIGVEDRINFYDQIGALADMGQNHLLQLLALVAMEIGGEKTEFFKKLRVDKSSLVLGQYQGYPKINSKTDTFFSLKTIIGSGPMKGVPVYIQAGKRMKKNVVEVVVVFKKNADKSHNLLIFRIQPNEGIVLRVVAKKPGVKMECEKIDLQFCYRQKTEKIIDAYVKLLVEIIDGNQSFFNQAEEVEWQWDFIDRLREINKVEVETYQVGGDGPSKSNDLIKKDGREWLVPEDGFCRI